MIHGVDVPDARANNDIVLAISVDIHDQWRSREIGAVLRFVGGEVQRWVVR